MQIRKWRRELGRPTRLFIRVKIQNPDIQPLEEAQGLKKGLMPEPQRMEPMYQLAQTEKRCKDY